MDILTCSSEQPAWCPTTTDEVLPSVLALLPSGVVWNGDRVDGTTKNKFWRAISELTAWVYKTLCDYEQEFYCDTATLSLDQWNRAWALGESCDPYGFNLCAKVTALGGQDFGFYEDLLLQSGYVIHCRNPDIPEPIAGCFEVGCTPLGPRPVRINNGSNIGYGALCQCSYGEIVHHPDANLFKFGSVGEPTCPMPGSRLGVTSGDPDCCMICGYYEAPVIPQQSVDDACVGDGVVYVLPAVNNAAAPELTMMPCDSTGKYSEYGHAYVWIVTVDIPASAALQALNVPPDDTPLANAGNMIAGCTPLCQPFDQSFAICLLEKIKPAHTQIIYEVVR